MYQSANDDVPENTVDLDLPNAMRTACACGDSPRSGVIAPDHPLVFGTLFQLEKGGKSVIPKIQ